MKITIARKAFATVAITAAAGLTVSLAAVPLPPVTDRAEIRPSFIASTSQVFAPTIAAGAVQVRPTSIASSAAVFAPSVQLGAVSVAPVFIASTAFVPSPRVERVEPGAVVILPAFIPSAASVFEPRVTPGAVTVSPALIEPTSFVLAPEVRPGNASISPAFIPSGAFVPVPVVQSGAATIAPAFIGSTAFVAAPSVQAGAVTIVPAFIPSSAFVIAPTVSAAAAGYDADSQAYFNAMTVQPNATRKGQIDALVKGLKSDGIWAKLIGYQLWASHDDQAGRVDLKAPSRVAQKINTPIFTVDRGFSGDGTGAYLDTMIADDPARMNGFAFGGHINVATGSNAGLLWWNSNAVRVFAGSGTRLRSTNDATLVGSGPVGFSAGDRASSASQESYFNGHLVQSRTAASSGTPSTSSSLTSHRSSSAAFSEGRIAAVFAALSLTADEHAKLYSRTLTFLNAIGAA